MGVFRIGSMLGPVIFGNWQALSVQRLRNEIDTLMAKYAGQEHVMYLKICNKHLGL